MWVQTFKRAFQGEYRCSVSSNGGGGAGGGGGGDGVYEARGLATRSSSCTQFTGNTACPSRGSLVDREEKQGPSGDGSGFTGNTMVPLHYDGAASTAMGGDGKTS